MFDLNEYLNSLISECREAFAGRFLYAGLQGSYLRGEAKENSDIDVMIVIDSFSPDDMRTYRDILKKIGYYDKSCGLSAAGMSFRSGIRLKSVILSTRRRTFSGISKVFCRTRRETTRSNSSD